MTQRLSEIKSRLAAATPGKWHFHGDRPYTGTEYGDCHLDGLFGGDWNKSDKDLIANAPADLAWLIEQVETAQNHNEVNAGLARVRLEENLKLKAELDVASERLNWACGHGIGSHCDQEPCGVRVRILNTLERMGRGK